MNRFVNAITTLKLLFFAPSKSISTLRMQQLLLLYFSKFLKNLRIVRENNAVCKDTNSYALAYGAASG